MLPFIGNIHQLKTKHGNLIPIYLKQFLNFISILEFLMQIRDLSYKYKNEPLWRIWLGKLKFSKDKIFNFFKGTMANYVFHKGEYTEVWNFILKEKYLII